MIAAATAWAAAASQECANVAADKIMQPAERMQPHRRKSAQVARTLRVQRAKRLLDQNEAADARRRRASGFKPV